MVYHVTSLSSRSLAWVGHSVVMRVRYHCSEPSVPVFHFVSIFSEAASVIIRIIIKPIDD